MIRTEVLSEWNGKDVKKRAEKLADKSTWAIGMAVLSNAKLLCPVKYGYLAASLMVAAYNQTTQLGSPSEFGTETGPKPARFQPIVKPNLSFDKPSEVFVGTAVEYGPYIEYGTVKSFAQPFLRPALDMAQGKALEIIRFNSKLVFAKYLTTRETFAQTNEAFSE